MMIGKMDIPKSTKDLGLFGWMEKKNKGVRLDFQMGFFFFFFFF